MEKKKNIFQTEKIFPFLKLIIPIAGALFGVFTWHDGVYLIVKESNQIQSFIGYTTLSFWLITLIYLFIKLKKTHFQSRMLIIIIAISISVEILGVFLYNNPSHYCIMEVLPLYYDYILNITFVFSIIGFSVMIFILFFFDFPIETNYITKIYYIKSQDSKKFYSFLEILTSFPTYIGIYHVFFMSVGVNNMGGCTIIPPLFVVLIATPWIVLMIIYFIYTSLIILMK